MHDLKTRLAALEQQMTTLLADNESLRAEVVALRAAPPAERSVDGCDRAVVVAGGSRPVSRRGMLAAAAGAAGGMLLAQAAPAAAANGDPVNAGQINGATATTSIVTTNGTGLYAQTGGTSGTAATPATGVSGIAAANSGWTAGVLGRAQSPAGAGVKGVATGQDSTGAIGVLGETSSRLGAGVEGRGLASTGYGAGVSGRSESTSGIGVRGFVPATTGQTYGVAGDSLSSSGVGVGGRAGAATGNTMGVRGTAISPNGIGVYGYNAATTGATGGFALYADGRLKVTGRSFLNAPNTPPSDADLSNASISFFLDPANNKLKVRVKYGNGTLKTGVVALA